MAQEKRFGIPGVPFPIGVEYYRPPTPKPEVWDADFARIRAAGLNIVRSFPYWQWFEPSPGVYEMDDIDLLFDTAAKHGLYVWLDIPTATHGAGPDWLLREYPDMRVINYRNEPVVQDAHPAYAQGAMVHCIDHPGVSRSGGRLPAARHQPLQGPAQPADLGDLGRAEPLIGLGGPGRRLPLLLRAHAGAIQGVAPSAVHVGRTQCRIRPPLPPLGGRRAAAVRPQRRRDALVPALPSRGHRRLPEVDDGPGQCHRSGARETRPRRLAAAAEGRILRPPGG